MSEDLVPFKAMDPGHRKKKNKRGKRSKKAEPEPEAEVEQCADSTSGHEGGSESSLHENGIRGDRDEGSSHGNGVNEKVTGEQTSEPRYLNSTTDPK